MKKWQWLLLLGLVLILSACAPGSEEFAAADDRANFFHGVWHGWIAPITLIVQLFDSDVGIYEANNTGWWYDFGYYIAIISGFGSIALSRRKQRRLRKKR